MCDVSIVSSPAPPGDMCVMDAAVELNTVFARPQRIINLSFLHRLDTVRHRGGGGGGGGGAAKCRGR